MASGLATESEEASFVPLVAALVPEHADGRTITTVGGPNKPSRLRQLVVESFERGAGKRAAASVDRI